VSTSTETLSIADLLRSVGACPEARQWADQRVVDRFKSKVVVSGDTGCWIWIGHVDRNGYGRFALNGRMRWAHICSYCLFVGDVPNGTELDHVCKTKRCVNPLHLEPVTHRVNMERADRGATVIHRQKTHCPQGHPYSGDNLVTWGRYRYCRICQTQYKRAYKARIKNAKDLR
jgi:hypothetical protein